MARLKLRKRVFRALTEGFKAGFKGRSSVPIVAKPLERPCVAAMEGEGAALVDGKLRAGQVDAALREEWGLEDGKEPS